jgi:hypothetical protein
MTCLVKIDQCFLSQIGHPMLINMLRQIKMTCLVKIDQCFLNQIGHPMLINMLN